MLPTIIKALITFVAAFFHIFFMGLQVQIWARGKKLQAVLVSPFISISFITVTYFVVLEGWASRISYVVAAMIASYVTIVFHQRYFKKQ